MNEQINQRKKWNPATTLVSDTADVGKGRKTAGKQATNLNTASGPSRGLQRETGSNSCRRPGEGGRHRWHYLRAGGACRRGWREGSTGMHAWGGVSGLASMAGAGDRGCTWDVTVMGGLEHYDKDFWLLHAGSVWRRGSGVQGF